MAKMWMPAMVWMLAAAHARGASPTTAPTLGLDAAVKTAESLPRMHSLLVSWHGELILERYFHSAHATSLADVKSASKSVISALVGIAIERGFLSGVNAPIAPYFPELSGSAADARKKRITIEDLLTMRSGLESTSRRNYGAWVQSPNWVRFVLSRRLLSSPGEQMDYSTGNTHLLSAIVTKATGHDTWSFAQEALAQPLGFSLARWPQDPQGIYFGGNEMLMTPRQMVKFGELYLHQGRLNGRQIVPAAWVAASFTARTQSPVSGHQYGYGWWMDELAGHPTYYAWGFGGQYIFVVPDLDLVVATTSSVSLGEDRREHRSTVYDLVEHLVIASIASASAGAEHVPQAAVRTAEPPF
jgi:CubicO group peptidase (beta-lactamase class C family)